MAAYLTCLTMLMAATHLVHVTMDTPANTGLSSNMDQPRPLTLLHRVDTDSDWKEVMMELPRSKSIWQWYGTDQHHTSIRDRKDHLASENRPRFTYDTFPLSGPDHIRHGTVTSAFGTHITTGNRTPPLIPLDHYKHCQSNRPPDVWYDGLFHELWQWPCYQNNDPGSHNHYVYEDNTKTFGPGSLKSDLATSNNSELGTARMDISTMRVIVCREKMETALPLPVCSLFS